MTVALSLVKVNKSFGVQPVIKDLSFSIDCKEKVGLIGKNGTGKSTLFKLLSRDDVPDSGEVVLTQGLRVAHLSQNPYFTLEATVRSSLEDALADHKKIIEQHTEIYEALKNTSDNYQLKEKLYVDLNNVEHYLNNMGWDIEHRLKKAQVMWGLPKLDIKINDLSGGWRKRVAIAQIWLQDPDVLIMDEPTNHLDQEQSEKLEFWLQQFTGALLLITHDRYLLDNVVDRMLELENGCITSYAGSYSDYLLEKANKELLESRLTDSMQNRLRTELNWLNRGAKARTRKSKLRINDVLKLKENVQNRLSKKQNTAIAFTTSSNRSDLLLAAKSLTFCYPNTNKELLGNLDLNLQRGQRIAIMGPNGCGKTTLINVLLGKLKPLSGLVNYCPNIAISAISQSRVEIKENLSIADNISEDASIINAFGQELLVSAYLAKFGFPVNQQKRLVATLSGGEQNRLLMAKAMIKKSDILALDEPTNDFDIPTLQNLGDAIINYSGTLLLVSHDRFFLNQVSTHTLIWNSDTVPRWELYEGNPITVQWLRDQRVSQDSLVLSKTLSNKTKATGNSSGYERTHSKIGLTQKELRRLNELESNIENFYTKIHDLELILSDPTAFIASDAIGHQALKDCNKAKLELESLELEWLALEEKK